MIEEIFNYKAPIAVIPEITFAKADLHNWERKKKRCSKKESIKFCDFEIRRAKERIDKLLSAKTSV